MKKRKPKGHEVWIAKLFVAVFLVYVLFFTDIFGNIVKWLFDKIWDVSPWLSFLLMFLLALHLIRWVPSFTKQQMKAKKDKRGWRFLWGLWGSSLFIRTLLAIGVLIFLIYLGTS
jgi:putative Mn2+ efflux pump MntP